MWDSKNKFKKVFEKSVKLFIIEDVIDICIEFVLCL